MESGHDPLELALRVARIFERLGVRYILGGSLASTTFGEPRATLDVDFAADLGLGQVVAFCDALGDEFVADRGWIADEVARRGAFQVLHLPSVTRIDVFVPAWAGVHLWKWQHRRRVTVSIDDGSALDVTSPEGIVIQKLCWFHAGGEVSDRQWRDILGVVKAQRGDLQLGEVRRWARDLEVEGLLDRALDAAGA